MNRRAQIDPHRYDTLWNLSRILRYIGWGIMILGAAAAVLFLVITLSAFGGLRFGGALLLVPALLNAGLMLGGAVALGITYLAFGELLRAIIDIAFFSMHTSQTVTGLAEAERSPVEMTGVKEELAQITAVLREVNTNTQKTAALLEQVTKPRTTTK